MRAPLVRVLLALRALCATAAAAIERVPAEDQLVEAGGSSGRRTGRLYCRVGIGFHLQIHPDGRVNGTHAPNQFSVLELFAISQGVVGIRGVFSERFLAMNKRGRLHATERFTDDCKFRERFQENSYNTYASVTHRNRRTGREWFVALNKRGKAKMGSSPRVKSQHVSTHFLPRFNMQDRIEQGFTFADRNVKQSAAPPSQPKPPPPSVVKANVGQKRLETVKYWPKFRFG
ncbi:fibroblast growth factor 5 [Arapaima gigas]